MEHKLAINPDGTIVMIYNDDNRELFEQGIVSITRVSSVEPNPDGSWSATMIDGVVLGPYKLRKDALDAEVKYLENKLF